MQTFTLLNSSFFAESGHNALWYWEQCDILARFVVGIVIVLSVWSISAIVQKWLDLKSINRRNEVFQSQLARVPKITSQRVPRTKNTAMPFELLTGEALAAYQRHLNKIRNEKDVEICMSHVENAIQRGIGRVLVHYEKSLVLLSSFVSGGPFLGLFGTVYGVMVTFGSLTEKATIAQLAPGVSGALVATFSGLLLAIPAVFAYNILLTTTKKMTTALEDFASQLADQIEVEMLERLRAEEADANADFSATNGVVEKTPLQNPYSAQKA